MVNVLQKGLHSPPVNLDKPKFSGFPSAHSQYLCVFVYSDFDPGSSFFRLCESGLMGTESILKPPKEYKNPPKYSKMPPTVFALKNTKIFFKGIFVFF